MATFKLEVITPLKKVLEKEVEKEVEKLAVGEMKIKSDGAE